MSVFNFRVSHWSALCGLALAALLGFAVGAAAQNQLPEVLVTAPKEQPKPKPQSKPVQVRAAPRPAPARAAAPAPAVPAQPVPAAPPVNPVAATADTLNQGLNTIYAPIGTI